MGESHKSNSDEKMKIKMSTYGVLCIQFNRETHVIYSSKLSEHECVISVESTIWK